MAVIQCNFTVPSAINGGKLTGNGFNGVPTSAPNQTTPSPFVNGSKYVCYGAQSVGKDANAPTYTFPALTYAGSQPGKYELTFVVEDGSTTPKTQWSEDPEFDTGN